ncbi:MAG: FAD-binding oxidoreductase, partial [Abditibacteriota bacterium]|nr:FAD-binding oxidoreductase [Abditibacteriota bacterium]
MDDLFKPVSGSAEECLSDESKLSGNGMGICFPRFPEEVAEAVKYARAKGLSLTLQGGLTGIVGGAVPQDTWIINTSRMKRIGPISDQNTIYVDAGVSLDELRAYIAPKGFYFPPDPTETSAFLGGMAASNASGAVSYGYGPMRAWIEELFLVTADGQQRSLKRGTVFAEGNGFELFGVKGELPDIHSVDVKSAAGLFVRPDMDMADLFIGCEGILAVITGMTLRLIRQPDICGAIMFPDSEEAAFCLVDTLRNRKDIHTVALEYF